MLAVASPWVKGKIAVIAGKPFVSLFSGWFCGSRLFDTLKALSLSMGKDAKTPSCLRLQVSRGLTNNPGYWLPIIEINRFS